MQSNIQSVNSTINASLSAINRSIASTEDGITNLQTQIDTLTTTVSTLDAASFTTSSKSIGSGTTSLSSYLPNNGKVYFVWVYNHLDSGDDLYTTVQTDIFPSTRINRVDVDSGRRSQSDACCVVPVGSGRSIKVNRSCTLVGYMRA